VAFNLRDEFEIFVRYLDVKRIPLHIEVKVESCVTPNSMLITLWKSGHPPSVIGFRFAGIVLTVSQAGQNILGVSGFRTLKLMVARQAIHLPY
jgi:hypothetical protein